MITDLQIPADAMVSLVPIKPKDIVVVYIEIGPMPKMRADSYMKHYKQVLDEAKLFPEGVRFMVAPMRDGKPLIDFTVITPP